MENVTDALIMAASVLLLIIALTVSISSFTSLKIQADAIVKQEETIDLTKMGDEYLNYIKANDDLRTVGVETVVSSVRRTMKESYTVYLYFNDNNISSETELGKTIKQFSENQEYEGNVIIRATDGTHTIIGFTLKGSDYKNLNDTVINQLYEYSKEKKFKEYLGEYQDNTETASVNKSTYRVITYVEI